MVVTLVVASLLPLSGCAYRESLCVDGEQVVENDGGGTACTEDGVVPEGYTTCPPELRPTYVDELYPPERWEADDGLSTWGGCLRPDGSPTLVPLE